MNKRGLDKISVSKVHSLGKKATAFIYNAMLVLDCYDDKVYLGRYVIDQNGNHAINDGKKWRKARLPRLYNMDPNYSYYAWFGSNRTEMDSKEDEETVIQYFDGKVKYYLPDPMNLIEQAETAYNERERERAYMRKCERINAFMSKVPHLTEDVDRWIKEDIYEGKEYMILNKKKGTYFCTACKKEHRFKDAKQGKIYTCKRTGKDAIVEKRREMIEKKTTIMIGHKIDEEYSVFRHFDVMRKWQTIADDDVILFENTRLFYNKITLRLDIYYGQYVGADEDHQLWWDTNSKNRRPNGEYCYPVGIAEALKDTPYDGMAIDLMAKKGWKAKYNPLMASQTRYFEYLVKANLENLAMDISNCMTVYSGFYSDKCELNEYGSNASELLNIDMQRFHRLKQANGGIAYLGWLQYEEEYGEKVPESAINWFEKNKIFPKDLEFIADRMSPVQVVNYLTRQQSQYKKSAKSLLGTWADYISMAKRLDLDTGDAIIYRCKMLLQRHDECVKELNDRADDKMISDLEQKYAKVKPVYKKIKSKYEFKNDEYVLVVPAGVRDIVMEGRALHHCVASSERYFDRIQSEESYIFFLRRADRPLNAYYTLEVEPGGTIRQKRTEYDRQTEDIKEAEKFLKMWQKEIKKRLKKEDVELAKKSKKLRVEGFEELKRSHKVIPAGELAGTPLADVLEADLMEAM